MTFWSKCEAKLTTAFCGNNVIWHISSQKANEFFLTKENVSGFLSTYYILFENWGFRTTSTIRSNLNKKIYSNVISHSVIGSIIRCMCRSKCKNMRILKIYVNFLSHLDNLSSNGTSEIDTISQAFDEALALLSSPNSTNSQAGVNAQSSLSPTLATPIEPPTTTDVYARALRYLERKDKERKYRSRTSYVRPRLTRISSTTDAGRLQVIGSDAANITKRMDGNEETVSEKEIDRMTDVMANLTLGSPANEGEGRSANGRSMDGFSSIFTKFTKVLDLGRVVREIETSVMTSVSCTACRAGEFFRPWKSLHLRSCLHLIQKTKNKTHQIYTFINYQGLDFFFTT